MTREIFLYSRKNCSLCVELQNHLQPLLTGKDVSLQVIDIDNDAELLHRYGARVPVLVTGQREICELRLDVDALQAWLQEGQD